MGDESLSEDDDLTVYKDFLLGSRFWVQRVLVPLIMMIGSVGNGITIIIMTHRKMRSSTNNYLAALAIFDMLYLIFTFILSLTHYPRINESHFLLYWQFKPYALWITDGCAYASVWVTVTFTIERYIVVSHPIQGKIICTEARARKVVIIVFILCFIFTSPTPFEHTVVQKVDQVNNVTLVHIEWSALGRDEVYRTIYYWLSVSLFTFIPLLLLAIFNTFLIRSVHISRKTRFEMTQSRVRSSPRDFESTESTVTGASTAPGGNSRSTIRTFVTNSGTSSRIENNSSQQETKITVMLIAVVILFMLCQLPGAVMLVFGSIHGDFDRHSKGWFITYGLNNIFNFLVAINAAGNFFLYSFFSQRYRRTFVSLFCPCYKNRLAHLQSTCVTNNTTTAVYGIATNASIGTGRSTCSVTTGTPGYKVARSKSHIDSEEDSNGHHLKQFNRNVRTKSVSHNPIADQHHSPTSQQQQQRASSFYKIT